jgi:Fic family protein
MTETKIHPNSWHPRYTITSAIARALMEIENARAAVGAVVLPSPAAAEELRYRARVRSTHYSTRIEGNRLSLAQTQQVVAGQTDRLPDRARDICEVRNYWQALLRVEEWARTRRELSVLLVQQLHALVEKGKRARPSTFRTEQNVIRDSVSGAIIYLPPEAKDVPTLMTELVHWTVAAEKENLPMPLVAGLVHYQFVTIHPYYDGNGRTARLLATLLLQKHGYGLNVFYSLEEHHARDLAAYYHSLETHPHHNYYEGRAVADLTPWLAYFIDTLRAVCGAAAEEVKQLGNHSTPAVPELLRRLDARGRRVLALFTGQETITSSDVAHLFGITTRMARLLLGAWQEQGLLTAIDKSNRARAYKLVEKYRKMVRNESMKNNNFNLS